MKPCKKSKHKRGSAFGNVNPVFFVCGPKLWNKISYKITFVILTLSLSNITLTLLSNFFIWSQHKAMWITFTKIMADVIYQWHKQFIRKKFCNYCKSTPPHLFIINTVKFSAKRSNLNYINWKQYTHTTTNTYTQICSYLLLIDKT